MGKANKIKKISKGTLTARQLVSATDFKNRVPNFANGAWYLGNQQQHDKIFMQKSRDLPEVSVIRYLGYYHFRDDVTGKTLSKGYVFPKMAMQDGKAVKPNNEDYFTMPDGFSIKSRLNKENDFQQ